MGSVKCALVVCDAAWRGAACGEDAAEEHCQAEDYLRMDALILVAQLNIRAALDVRGPLPCPCPALPGPCPALPLPLRALALLLCPLQQAQPCASPRRLCPWGLPACPLPQQHAQPRASPQCAMRSRPALSASCSMHSPTPALPCLPGCCEAA
jgi:hypothetical protein